jgi:hypothetical protein
MAFSATDWRNRMAYYDNTYSYVGFDWGSLGGAMVRQFYLAQGPFYNGLYLAYRNYNFGIDCPVVEAFTSTGYFYVNYSISEFYTTEFGYGFPYYTSGNYYTGTWSFYYPNNTYGTTVMYWYNPGTSYYTYYYSGFPYAFFSHYQGYSAGYSSLAASPNTFYNYAYGPYLSYYRYSLSSGNGPYTNYPYQSIVV